MLRVIVRRLGQAVGPALDLADGRLLIGADPMAAVRLPAADAAEAHAWLHAGTGAAPHLEALAAVRVNGVDVPRGTTHALVLPAAIDVGACTLVIEASTATAASGAVRTSSLARELVRQLMEEHAATPAAVELVVLRGPGVGARRALPLGRIVVGRGDDADWNVLDLDLSRQHAAVERTWDGVVVFDLGSKNGTRVDGASVGPDGVPVPIGATIELGLTALALVDPAEVALRVTRPQAVAAGMTSFVPIQLSASSPAAVAAHAPARAGSRIAFWLAAGLALLAAAALVYILAGG